MGKRGEGKFERISWDEATSLIAENVTRLTQQHGAASRFLYGKIPPSLGDLLW